MRNVYFFAFAALVLTGAGAWAADQKVAIRFQARVGDEKLACGQTYSGIGTTASKISPRDFRFYVHDVALIDQSGKSVPVQLEQDGKWQLDDVALLDFENGTAGYVNGTPDLNDRVGRTIKAGPNAGVGSENPNKSEFVKRFDLSSQDKAEILAFLRSLTDRTVLADRTLSDPFTPASQLAPKENRSQ
ncbi:MAG TPA: MbnP family protein [Verrucomicrobiae bacterium]|nr:MbnP family protein [Verrucomicrobiae bacterium]